MAARGKTGGGVGTNQYQIKRANSTTKPPIPDHVKAIRALAGPLSTQAITALADDLYDLPGRSAYFEHAWATWPKYNDGEEDTDEACAYITDQLMDEAARGGLLFGMLSQDIDKIRDSVSDGVYNGLT